MRQRFKAISVSRNIASCFGGNLGWREELTGSLTDLGTAELDVKANQGVAERTVSRHPNSATRLYRGWKDCFFRPTGF
jgi:hypothetical protein